MRTRAFILRKLGTTKGAGRRRDVNRLRPLERREKEGKAGRLQKRRQHWSMMGPMSRWVPCRVIPAYILKAEQTGAAYGSDVGWQ